MTEPKQYYIYIMTSQSGTLYIGLTNNIKRRIFQHKQKLIPGFTQRYNIKKLVYFETFSDISSTISREKTIKAWRRQKKLDLINEKNPTWADISEGWYA